LMRPPNPPGSNETATKDTFSPHTAIEIGRTGFPDGVHDVDCSFLFINQAV